MKTIPVLRDKKREIFNSVFSLFGDAGSSEINFGLLSYDGRYGILRCAREKTSDTRAALACVNTVRGQRISILVLGMSGTIKGATEKFIQQSIIKESEPE